MGEGPKPSICNCLRSRAAIAVGNSCHNCGHPREAHDYDAGCVDGIDHPGSVEPEQSAPHGPSAEQWARGIVLLAMNLRPATIGGDTAEELTQDYRDALAYILHGTARG